MMNIRKNKTIVCIITTLLIIAGSFLMGTPAGKVEASEATAISEKVLSVKCQLSEDKTKLRMVTTIDGQLQYKNVGFIVTFLGDNEVPAKTKSNTVKYVYRRINSTDNAVKYEFGPKAFHASSEWFATYTVTNIPEAYLDNGIIIKPYVTMKDTGVRVYGEHRYLTMLDQDNDIVSLPIKGKLTNPTVEGVAVDKYYDGTYTHVRVDADYATLPSISTYTVTDGGTEYTGKYRYLHSTVANDQSWYQKSDADDKVIVTAGDMRGFQTLSSGANFATDTIYLGASIDLNPGWTAGSGVPSNVWTPIGRSASDTSVIVPFRGTFDGDRHTIKGVYVSSASDRIGLFATTGAGAKIQNFTLENSIINSTKTSSTGSVGSIVGRLGGILDTVKSSADVVLAGSEYAGGLVGDINSTVGATITNCWFAGSVTGTGSHHGQLLGGVRKVLTSDTLNTCTVSHCLATGTIEYRGNTGGLIGTLWGSSTVNISDSLFAGTFIDVGTTGTYGTVVGNSLNGTVNVSTVYVQKGCGIENAVGIGNTGTGTHNEGQRANVKNVEVKELYLDDARENTELTIYPQEQDTSSDGDNKQFWWYTSETHPILASFGETVEYTKLKVATYNIGSCIKLGTDNHTSVLGDVVNFIYDNNIDVCMLQEVDKNCTRTGSVDQAKAIATGLKELTGKEYYYAYVPALENTWVPIYGTITSCGIAIVSRYPITSQPAIEDGSMAYLEFDGQEEKRVIAKAMVDVDGTETAVIFTHFDNAEDSTVREKAVEVLKTMLDGIDASTPVIFGGDLNQAYGGEDTAVISTISQYLTSVTKSRYDATTSMAGSTWYQLDYIFTNALVECGRAKVYTPTSTTVEGELSDHRPLVVNLYMNIK